MTTSAWTMVIWVASVSADGGAAPDWNQWRGPSRSGFVDEGSPWPGNLDGLTLRWRADLSEGYPGPIVGGGMVFVAETKNEKDEVVRALDRETGKELWSTQWAGSLKVPFFARENGDWIRSTPAYDGESVYVGGIRDVVVCLDAKSGATRWTLDFAEEFKTALPTFGFVCSPMIMGDYLYVQAGGGFCKVDKKTGKVIWRTLDDGGGMMGSAFSSPVFEELAGRKQFIVQTRTKLAGVEDETGKVLWTQDVPNFRGMNILTPIVLGGGVFTSSYNNKTYFFSVQQSGDAMTSTKTWENKVKGYMSTPVVIDGHAYLHLQNQRVACVRIADGQETWISSRRFGKYWSMVAQKDRILALDEEGVLFLVEANPKEFKILGEKKVSDQETWGHLAISGQDVFIRELKGISSWRWEPAAAVKN